MMNLRKLLITTPLILLSLSACKSSDVTGVVDVQGNSSGNPNVAGLKFSFKHLGGNNIPNSCAIVFIWNDLPGGDEFDVTVDTKIIGFDQFGIKTVLPNSTLTTESAVSNGAWTSKDGAAPFIITYPNSYTALHDEFFTLTLDKLVSRNRDGSNLKAIISTPVQLSDDQLQASYLACNSIYSVYVDGPGSPTNSRSSARLKLISQYQFENHKAFSEAAELIGSRATAAKTYPRTFLRFLGKNAIGSAITQADIDAAAADTKIVPQAIKVLADGMNHRIAH